MAHGYRPLRALAWGLAIVILGIVFFQVGHWAGHMPQTNEFDQATNPTFYSIVYSADTFLPIIDLGWQEQWRPDGRGWGGWFLLVWYWTEIGLGWIVSSTAILGLTGLVRQET
jgi:hypothetical protein